MKVEKMVLLGCLGLVATGCGNRDVGHILKPLKFPENVAEGLEYLQIDVVYFNVYANPQEAHVVLGLRVAFPDERAPGDTDQAILHFSKVTLRSGDVTHTLDLEIADNYYSMGPMVPFPGFNGLIRPGEVRMLTYHAGIPSAFAEGATVEIEFTIREHCRKDMRKTWKAKTRVEFVSDFPILDSSTC